MEKGLEVNNTDKVWWLEQHWTSLVLHWWDDDEVYEYDHLVDNYVYNSLTESDWRYAVREWNTTEWYDDWVESEKECYDPCNEDYVYCESWDFYIYYDYHDSTYLTLHDTIHSFNDLLNSIKEEINDEDSWAILCDECINRIQELYDSWREYCMEHEQEERERKERLANKDKVLVYWH